MGGLLALYVASQRPEVAGILTYAPAMKISTWTVIQAYVAAPFLSHVAKKNLKTMNKNWQGYTVNTIPGVVQLHRLQQAVRRRLPQVQQPLLIIPGRLDIDIDLRGIDIVYREAGSATKELHWMEKSDHLVILGRELAEVTARTLSFMERALNNFTAES
jgi:carboxylesterase